MRPGLGIDPFGGRIFATGGDLSHLVSGLTRATGRLVIDRTGLTGVYDYDVSFARGPGDDGPSIFAAVQGQLGFKLEPGENLIDAVVIQRIDRPSPN